MNGKKLIATCLIAGIIGMNFAPAMTFALTDKKTVKQEKKLTKKQKKTQQEAQNRLNYVNIDWWESYNDEYLQTYIYQAIANNQDAQIATLKVEEARQTARLQLSQELPQIMVGASPAYIKTPEIPYLSNPIKAFSIPIVASYEPDIFLKNRDKTRSAKKLYEASQYKEKATYIGIVSQVGSTYYNIVKLDKLIDLQEEIIKDRKEIYELMKMSNEAGIVSTADLVKADKAYVAATSDIIELKKAREIMLNALAVLIGENPNNSKDLKRISYDKVQNLKAIPNAIPSDVITQRPDYLVAQKMIEKAGIDVRVAKKEFLPTFNILGAMSFNITSITNTMDWSNALALAGINALMPVFTGGRKIATLKINKNRYKQAILTYQKTNLVAIKEVNDSLSTLKLDNEKYNKNVKTLAMEKKDFGYTQDRYDAGIISKLDLLQRKETLLVVKKVVVSSKTDCLVNQISLYKAVAGNI